MKIRVLNYHVITSALIGKYRTIESIAAMGNVRNQIKTILMLPLFLGAC